LTWELGITIYRSVFGYYPFSSKRNSKDLTIKDMYLTEPKLKCNEVEVSEMCIELLKSLLEKDAYKRASLNSCVIQNWLSNE